MSRLELTVQDILWTLKRNILWILIITLTFVIGAFAYTEFFVTPTYITGVKMGVNIAPIADNQTIKNNSELSAERSIAFTYEKILTTRVVAEAVSRELDGAVSVPKVQSMVRARVQDNTMIINVTVQDSDPQRATNVANALARVAPIEIAKFPTGGLMYCIEDARLPVKPVSPNKTLNIIIGLFLGLILSCTAFILVSILDTTIWREEDLEKVFNIPVLGNVPCIKANRSVRQGSRSVGGQK